MYDDTTLTKINRKSRKRGAFLVETNKFKAVLIKSAPTGDRLLASSPADFIESLEL